MAAAVYIPVLGWEGRLAKGGSGVIKTAKPMNAATHSLDAYKTTKGMEILSKTEKGIYGLYTGNSAWEFGTGTDMFGNQLTEEQRMNALWGGLTMGAAGGAAHIIDKGGLRKLADKAPYSTAYAKNVNVENGVAVNPKGYKETGQGKGNKENKFLKFAKINERSIAKVVPKGKFVKKKFDWGEHFRHSAEVTLNSNPATMGLQDQVKMLTGHDLLTFKKVSDLERKQSASAWVDGIPIASNIKSAVEVNSGVNTITGEKLSGFDKAAAALTIVGGAYTRPIKPGIKAVKTIPKQFVRKADDVVGRVDKETGAFKALNKGMDSSIQYGETGGRNISPEQFFKEEAIAEEMYEKFRNLGTEDVNAIAKNSGFSVARIQRIKDHVFNNSHIKDHGVGRFDPDYELGQAWQRLIDGKQVDADIQLLHHEIFESKFEGIFQTNYRTAHDKTIESGRPWNWEKNYEE